MPIETGSMIACKIAAMVPDRVLSLALLNAMGGDLFLRHYDLSIDDAIFGRC